MTSTEIRRRPDGSIDTDYYTDRGRVLRSQAATQATRDAGKAAPTMLSSFGALVASFLIGQRNA